MVGTCVSWRRWRTSRSSVRGVGTRRRRCFTCLPMSDMSRCAPRYCHGPAALYSLYEGGPASSAVFTDDRLVGDSQVRFDSLFDHARFGGVGEAAQELDALAVREGGEEVVGVGGIV